MAKINDYFKSLDMRMRQDFSRIRSQMKDRDAKGHANENTLGLFIERYVPQIKLRYNVEIIDHIGSSSGEMDICACNDFQLPGENILLLSQGVDFVVQVKAVLTGDELSRIASNARSLKSVVRAFDRQTDRLFAYKPALVPHIIARIPYFVFAYESSITLGTALKKWQAIIRDQAIPPISQPDAIFVLDRGALLRFFPDGSTPARENAATSEWFIAEFEQSTLLHFTDFLLSFGRGIQYVQNPLKAYLQESEITATLHESSFGLIATGDSLDDNFWELLERSYGLLATSECSQPKLQEEAVRRVECVMACKKGAFPVAAIKVRLIDGTPLIANDSLLLEIQNFIRYMVGKDPALSPAPRADMPFQFESSVINKAVEVEIRQEFLKELQEWPLINCTAFRPRTSQ